MGDNPQTGRKIRVSSDRSRETGSTAKPGFDLASRPFRSIYDKLPVLETGSNAVGSRVAA